MEATESSRPLGPQHAVAVPVDWSDLPADLLETISKKLHDLFDFIYFRMVCKKWRAATRVSDLPSQVPWLFHHDLYRDLCCYSIISGKTLTIRWPRSRAIVLSGPSLGYLHAKDYDTENMRRFLLNPLTNHEVIIEPSPHAFMVCMGPGPIGSDDHIAFLDRLVPHGLQFYQPRSHEWKTVDWPDQYGNLLSGSPNACLKGMYFRDLTQIGMTVVVDIVSHSFSLVPSPENTDDSDKVYFVDSVGKILRIVKQLNRSFNIYQFYVGDQNESRWAKISSIGDQILFLDWHSGMSITAYETTGLRGNCIYYFQRLTDGSNEVCKYNIEVGRTEKIPCSLPRVTSWFVPCIVGSSYSAGSYYRKSE